MLYVNDETIRQLDIEWEALFALIRKAVYIKRSGDYCQPIKPYLRYGDPSNRIIAMPAYLGGDVNVAGIKWIASFPENTRIGLSRAHCSIILNDVLTGIPLVLLNSPTISALRTAAVSGAMVNEYINERNTPITVGIIGWGPIGKCHFRMINDCFRDCVEQYYVFDLNPITDIDESDSSAIITVAKTWDELYCASDIVITCTVSSFPYIDLEPKKESLLLNISLRDFKPSVYQWVKNSIIVDDWDEVCRENTDIENMCNTWGLSKENTMDMYDVLFDSKMKIIKSLPMMFNPMGMAIYDMAISQYFYKRLLQEGLGTKLD